METFKGALLIVTLAGQMPVVRQTAAEGTPRAGRASTATLSSVRSKVLGRNESLGLAIMQKPETRMACGPQEETSEQTVNPTAILRAMRIAIAQGLRARNEAPQELPPELVALLDRLREQQQ
jgi:hypothetical protein